MSTDNTLEVMHEHTTEEMTPTNSEVSEDHHERKEIKSEMTEKEQKGIAEMKPLVLQQLPDHDPKPFTLLRFLRARKYDIQAAVDQYVKTVHWRKANKVDQWHENPPVHLRKLVPEAFHGFDKKGFPFYIVKAGQLDPSHVKKISVQDFMDVHIWGMEYSFQRCEESSKRVGRNIDRFTNVVDLHGLGLKHRKCLDYLKAVSAVDERYYPETLEHTYIINAPWVFSAFWSIVRPWLDPVTAAKVTVLGSDFREQLLQVVDADQLPQEYGGTCNCPGGCVRVYTTEEIEEALKACEAKIEFTEVAIKAKGKHEIQFRVGKTGGLVHYHFLTKANDIKFGITFKPDANPEHIVVLLAADRVKSNKSPIKGTVEVEEPGIATLTWDNGYSMWTDKVLRYHCDAENYPEDDALMLEAAKAKAAMSSQAVASTS